MGVEQIPETRAPRVEPSSRSRGERRAIVPATAAVGRGATAAEVADAAAAEVADAAAAVGRGATAAEVADAAAADTDSDTEAAVVVLCRYEDESGGAREVIRRAGALDSTLVVDRRARDHGDARLIAHLAAEEPDGNAEVVCAAYMRSPDASSCRRMLADDLAIAPVGELETLAAQPLDVNDEEMLATTVKRVAVGGRAPLCLAASALTTRAGARCALELRFTGMSIPELRWCVQGPRERNSALASLREVIGALERYEPARSLTARAIAGHREDPDVSVSTLSVELERMNTSRTVLNRGLRAAVLASVHTGSASMSEIALRCGRVKKAHGLPSGETSWLARRIGATPDAPGCAPTPWVRSDVLALIARSGLGVSPREVEVQ
ncbi:MAG: hypothetical protein ACYCUM_12620 [Solirubrobacteraceae bacterium]